MFDLTAMTPQQFDEFMKQKLDEFAEKVATSPDYQFARDGEKMGVGDWFEQFACHSELM